MDKQKRQVKRTAQLCIADKYGVWRDRVLAIAKDTYERNPEGFDIEQLEKYTNNRCIAPIIRKLINNEYNKLIDEGHLPSEDLRAGLSK